MWHSATRAHAVGSNGAPKNRDRRRTARARRAHGSCTDARVTSVIDWIDRAIEGEILIATDFDGTLTPIVERPEDARLDGRAQRVLSALARGRGTHVAILSGRTLTDVAAKVSAIAPVWIAGDHGSVVADPENHVHRFDDTRYDARLAALRTRAEDLARVFAGATVEVKPRGVALHYRQVPAHKHEAIIEMFRLSCAAYRVHPLLGRMVVEGRCGDGDKGMALRYIMSRLPKETSVVYVGDDATDEPALAYAHQHPRGLALHIVSEERVAPRLPVSGWLNGPNEWLEILEAIAQLRRRHVPS